VRNGYPSGMVFRGSNLATTRHSSRERIRQIETDAPRKLRHYLHSHKLRAFLDCA
jgi:DNA-directed RNA polymerase sigma subunit (sigma70/sigma32)